MNNEVSCAYCSDKRNQPLNSTAAYSGIEVDILPLTSIMRVRFGYCNDLDGQKFDAASSQDIVNIKFCPMCGRKLD